MQQIQTYRANIDLKSGDETIVFNPDTGVITVDGKAVQTKKTGDTYSFTPVSSEDKCNITSVSVTINATTSTMTVDEAHTLKGPCMPYDTNHFSGGQDSPVPKDLTTHATSLHKAIKPVHKAIKPGA
jgi:hypothetical protein